MNEILTLIKREADGTQTLRTVLCGVRSVGMREFYESHAVDFHPELTFVLADYLDYDNETLLEHSGQYYRVLRTYRTGHELELVVERAPAEDGGIYGA